MYGKDQQLVQLLVQEPPGSPQALEVGKVFCSESLKQHIFSNI